MKKKCKICDYRTEILFNIKLINASFLYNMNNVNIVNCLKCGFCFNDTIQNDCNEYYSNTNNYDSSLFYNENLHIFCKQCIYYNLLELIYIINENDIIDEEKCDTNCSYTIKPDSNN
jgi:hypothetical protein